MRNNKNCYMSCVLILKCEHVAEVMEISDLTASSSASVEGMFVGAVSPIKTSSTAVVDYLRFTSLASLSSLVSLSLLIL